MKKLVCSLLMAGSLVAATAEASTFRMAHPVGYGGAESLDPISPNRFFFVNQLLYSRLVRQGDNGQPSPDIATDWRASEDARQWTFKLRKGVKFHDGTELTAADVKYTLERIKDPKLDSPVAAVLSVVDSVDLIDDYSVRINLSAAHADLPLLLMDYRIRIIPQGSGDNIAKSGIGSGPFMLAELDAAGTTVLKANPDYWEGRPGVDEVEVIGIPDLQARVQALMAGQIDYEPAVSVQQLRLFSGNPQFKVQSIATGEWRGIIFRTDTKPYDDPRVRKALRLATDRQQMIELVSGKDGGVVTCDQPVWSGDQYRAEIDCGQNIEEAKRLLQEAGYPDGIEIDIHTANLEPEFVRMVEVYQQQAAQAGIKVNLKMEATDGYWSDVWMQKPAFTTRWSQRPADQILNEGFRSTAKWNESYFSNSRFDQMLDNARQELDFDKRKALYGDLQRALFEEGGALIPFHTNQYRVMSSRVSGIDPVEKFSIRWHKLAVN